MAGAHAIQDDDARVVSLTPQHAAALRNEALAIAGTSGDIEREADNGQLAHAWRVLRRWEGCLTILEMCEAGVLVIDESTRPLLDTLHRDLAATRAYLAAETLRLARARPSRGARRGERRPRRDQGVSRCGWAAGRVSRRLPVSLMASPMHPTTHLHKTLQIWSASRTRTRRIVQLIPANLFLRRIYW